MTFTRTWLRSFLHLGARMDKDGVPLADIERQEDTVLHALDTLAARPGLILADEVGMGKTFEALGVMAATLHTDPQARMCVVTPGPDLNAKWRRELEHFSDPEGTIFDFAGRGTAATKLDELVHAFRTHQIVIVPVSAFQGARGGSDLRYLLSLFARWQGLHGTTTNALFRRFRDGALERVDTSRESFLDAFPYAEIEPLLDEAFQDDAQSTGLATLFNTGGIEAFASDDAVRRGLDLARFRLVRALLPDLSLLVVDEAHKLKNPESLRHRGIATVFGRKYERALFLTATPFQLDIAELRQVFSLFGHATTAPATMPDEVEALFEHIAHYQRLYDTLEERWRRLDAAEAATLGALYRTDPTLTVLAEPTLVPVVDAIRAVRALKESSLEPGFRRWIVRSIHQQKRDYRSHERIVVAPENESLLPFLVYERFVAELFHAGDATHKASVEVNMVSSFEAAAKGALFDEDRAMKPSAEPYRALLRDVLGTPDDLRDHPKLSAVVGETLQAARDGDKTLIFCARVETIRKLARELEDRWEGHVLDVWRQLYPGATRDEIFGTRDDGHRERGFFERIRDRFHRTQDALYLALRERYLQTLVPASSSVFGNEDEIAARATRLLRDLRVDQTAAARIDYQLAKRCVERATVELWREHHTVAAKHQQAVDALCSDAFLDHGIDLVADDLETTEPGDHAPSWSLSAAHVELLVGPRPHNLWHTLVGELRQLTTGGVPDMILRVRVVERLARYLTRRDVLFLPELLLAAREHGIDLDDVESHALLDFVDDFWQRPDGQRWLERIREFFRYFLKRPLGQRREIIDGPIAQGSFVRHTVDGETREGLREAFNTPLHPMVLIANEVMQEGLDLHHNCRRIVHHDLAWNPAQLEQRVGRIDRIGSLLSRQRAYQPTTTLDIHYPLVTRTIDERMYRTVKTREKWLEFLLGARPSFNELSPDEPPAPDLPTGLAESLVVDLRPPRAVDN